jgi:hypothetical protein
MRPLLFSLLAFSLLLVTGGTALLAQGVPGQPAVAPQTPRQDIATVVQIATAQSAVAGLLCYEASWSGGVGARGCAGASAGYTWVSAASLYRPRWLAWSEGPQPASSAEWSLNGGGGLQLVWAENFAGNFVDARVLGPGVVASIDLTRLAPAAAVGFGVQLDGGVVFNAATADQSLTNVLRAFGRFSVALALP